MIRLEEGSATPISLSAELAARSAALTVPQIVALRFAPDDELAGLVERSLNGEFTGTKDLKQAIKNWRGDHLRA